MKNIMHVFVLRQMKGQKRRTVITILGVIVAVAMIAAVSSFAASFADLFYREEADCDGEWHVLISNVSPEGRENIAADPAVRDITPRFNAEERAFPEKIGKYTGAILNFTDEAGFSLMHIAMDQGRYPENDREVAVNISFFDSEKLRLGDPISLLDEQGRETVYTLCGAGSLNPYFYGESGKAAFLTLASPDQMQETGAVYVRLKHPDKGTEKWAESMCLRLPGEQTFNTHYSLLLYRGATGEGDALTASITVVSAILIAIIMASAVTLIYNSFAISVSQRSAQFGMLASVGATKKQRRSAVLFESLLVAAIAIPFGLLFGYLGIGITFKIVSGILVSNFVTSTDQTLRLVISPLAMGVSVLLAILTVLLSAWLPAKRAAKISPIDAIRKTQDIKLTGKAVKTGPLTRLIFGFEGTLALKNLKRHKGRFRITVFSLAMSLILFISAYSFSMLLTGSYELTEIGEMGDLAVRLWQEDQYYQQIDGQSTVPVVVDTISHDTILRAKEELLVLPGLTEKITYTEYDHAHLYWPDQEDVPLTGKAKALFSAAPGESAYGVNDEMLSLLAEKAGADLNALYDTEHPAAILVNRITVRSGSSFSEIDVLNVQKGDSIRQQMTGERQSDFLDLRIAGILSEVPMGLAKQLSFPLVYLLFSEPVLDHIMQQKGSISISFMARAQDPDAAEGEMLSALEKYYSRWQDVTTSPEDAERLEALKAGKYIHFSCVNLNSQIRQMEKISLIFNIFIYGFITLLCLVGVANIIGTISTSFMLRRREFAMLKSVGMGGRAFDRMVMCESLFYGLKAILWGVPISLGLSYLMWLSMQDSFSMPFQPPIRQLLIGILGIFLLVILTMIYSVGKIRKDSIVEDLRLE